MKTELQEDVWKVSKERSGGGGPHNLTIQVRDSRVLKFRNCRIKFHILFANALLIFEHISEQASDFSTIYREVGV
jgi:hypothetical protein